MSESLALKWGTLKGYELETEASHAAAQAYLNTGTQSASAMGQYDSPEQKEALCALIDAVAASGGEVYSDWSGETFTAEKAKSYVQEYGG